MCWTFLLRLLLDSTAATLLLLAMAYYWLDNTVHETVGAGLFLLILLHNTLNRRWYGAMPTKRREARGLIDIVLTVSLLAAMLMLLLTSVLISRTVFDFLPFEESFAARQLHVLAAYVGVILMGLHLGIRWPMVMSMARRVLGIQGSSRVRMLALRATAAAMTAQGVWSSFEMGVGGKLALQMSMDWWDFEASVAGFFVHWICIVAMYACLAHFVMRWIHARRRKVVGAVAL